MSVKIDVLPVAHFNNNLQGVGRCRKYPTGSTTSGQDLKMLSDSRTLGIATSKTSSGPLKHHLRREDLNFHRSISEPQGQNLDRSGGVLCPPTDLVLSPPSCSPSLHPSKRCKMMAPKAKRPPSLPSICLTGFGTPEEERPHRQEGTKSISNLLIPPAGSVSLPTSPCNESSTLQRAMVMKKVTTMEPDILASKLSSKRLCLLIDCRPFTSYNVCHIKGAINVNCCNKFNRRRLQQGKATLADLATTKDGKELLKRRNWTDVVVYDDCSDSLENLPSSHTLFFVLNSLIEDNRSPVMLLGGLREFQKSHREWCEDHLVGTSNGACIDVQGSPLLPDLPSPSDICNMKDIENHPATQVLPHMFLGNMKDASDIRILQSLGVGYVLNVTAKPPSYDMHPSINYKQLVASDNGFQNLRQFFDEAFEFIDEAKRNQSGVLIHCQAGISRSPTIAVAYLMKHYPMAMQEAYKFVKTRRSIISPNLNFMGQLWEFEQVLATSGKGGSTSSEYDSSLSEQSSESMATPTSASSTDSHFSMASIDQKEKRKSSLASAIEEACNNSSPQPPDLWTEKVAASTAGTSKTIGSF